jgi:Pal1 cell morphology protein
LRALSTSQRSSCIDTSCKETLLAKKLYSQRNSTCKETLLAKKLYSQRNSTRKMLAERPPVRPGPYSRSHSHGSVYQVEQTKKTPSHATRPRRKRRSSIGPDTIDRLDDSIFGSPYHHEGPYDATMLAMQLNGSHRSPVAALKTSNAAAIAATPRANLIDSLERHKPLQGTAIVAPNTRLPNGEYIGEYDEYDLMREDGFNYKRYPGIVCIPPPIRVV